MENNLKKQVNSAVADFIGGACLSDEQIELLYNNIDLIDKVGDINNCNTYSFVDCIERVNDIRRRNSNSYLRTCVANAFADSYNEANKFDATEEVRFGIFLNAGGYPNNELLAIDAKYMLSIREYIDIYKKCFEMCIAGARTGEIAKIL